MGGTSIPVETPRSREHLLELWRIAYLDLAVPPDRAVFFASPFKYFVKRSC